MKRGTARRCTETADPVMWYKSCRCAATFRAEDSVGMTFTRGSNNDEQAMSAGVGNGAGDIPWRLRIELGLGFVDEHFGGKTALERALGYMNSTRGAGEYINGYTLCTRVSRVTAPA